MVDELFRGKRIDNGEWVEGDFSRPCNIVFESIGYDEVLKQENVPIFNDFEVIPDTVGRLTKINGIKFGEGDIVEVVVLPNGSIKTRGVITFGEFDDSNDNVYTGFYIKWIGEVYKYRKSIKWWVINRSLQIIGNIHDNPELLREV